MTVTARTIVPHPISIDGIGHDNISHTPVFPIFLIGAIETFIPTLGLVTGAKVGEIVTKPNHRLQFSIFGDPFVLIPLIPQLARHIRMKHARHEEVGVARIILGIHGGHRKAQHGKIGNCRRAGGVTATCHIKKLDAVLNQPDRKWHGTGACFRTLRQAIFVPSNGVKISTRQSEPGIILTIIEYGLIAVGEYTMPRAKGTTVRFYDRFDSQFRKIKGLTIKGALFGTGVQPDERVDIVMVSDIHGQTEEYDSRDSPCGPLVQQSEYDSRDFLVFMRTIPPHQFSPRLPSTT